MTTGRRGRQLAAHRATAAHEEEARSHDYDPNKLADSPEVTTRSANSHRYLTNEEVETSLRGQIEFEQQQQQVDRIVSDLSLGSVEPKPAPQLDRMEFE
ncbi:hypothetical protein CHU98_g10525 [Xylaria longipes]|nr:hypothetical protein CHU98_g10525 [Xylaria longipes]